MKEAIWKIILIIVRLITAIRMSATRPKMSKGVVMSSGKVVSGLVRKVPNPSRKPIIARIKATNKTEPKFIRVKRKRLRALCLKSCQDCLKRSGIEDN